MSRLYEIYVLEVSSCGLLAARTLPKKEEVKLAAVEACVEPNPDAHIAENVTAPAGPLEYKRISRQPTHKIPSLKYTVSLSGIHL